MKKSSKDLLIIGWREWLELPDLGIAHIKAKVDTGARTSALHAFFVEPYQQDGEEWVRFGIHPKQGDTDTVIECSKPVKDRRVVTDSGGHKEERYVIETTLVLGPLVWSGELTLTDRDSMKFRMLLGRSAIRGNLLVDSNASYLLGKKPVRHYRERQSVIN